MLELGVGNGDSLPGDCLYSTSLRDPLVTFHRAEYFTSIYHVLYNQKLPCSRGLSYMIFNQNHLAVWGKQMIDILVVDGKNWRHKLC